MIKKWQSIISKSENLENSSMLKNYSIGKLVDLSELSYNSPPDDQHETLDTHNIYNTETLMK